MNMPSDDLLIERYREANALDGARPSPALRPAVLAQARLDHRDAQGLDAANHAQQAGQDHHVPLLTTVPGR